MDLPGITRIPIQFCTQIAKLILRKLIQREFSQIDQRRSILTLTESGLSIYNKVVPLAVEFERQLLKCFSGSEYEQFSKLLERYRDANGCIFH